MFSIGHEDSSKEHGNEDRMEIFSELMACSNDIIPKSPPFSIFRAGFLTSK